MLGVELRSCVKVEVVAQGSSSLISLMVSADCKEYVLQLWSFAFRSAVDKRQLFVSFSMDTWPFGRILGRYRLLHKHMHCKMCGKGGGGGLSGWRV